VYFIVFSDIYKELRRF